MIMNRQFATNRNSSIGPGGPAHQSGAALLVCLLMLLVLSLLAVAGMRDTTLQEKMVSAQKDSQMALAMAEDALHQVEKQIDDNTVVLADFNNSAELYAPGAAPDATSQAIWSSSSTATSAVTATATEWQAEYGSSVPSPRYFIELIGSTASANNPGDVNLAGRADYDTGGGTTIGFRIVVRSTGLTGKTQRIIEEFYGRQI